MCAFVPLYIGLYFKKRNILTCVTKITTYAYLAFSPIKISNYIEVLLV